ncbi:phosphofructokinase [Tardibacter chloracetimidivorans]|uniref:Phosphofructokinase n=1 Tax=Tardibacter chloracetimidivorans TaxID=1921510 RepID=A0A1L3ZXS3_9SPHN|nr:ATP-dependent 6-phosphofructokinase [Tardibacter chloracetimidivorans]API60427.1 phosphofructokinase [Tardibacter chloracetimidivorans]
MHIGILTGGGDVPGLNACIRSVTLSALDLSWEVTGFRRGWQGFLSVDPDNVQSVADHTRRLDREAVRGIDRMGGTILHTSRTDPRTTKDGDRTDHVLHVLKSLGIDAMITLGGDGTLRFSAHLASLGFPVISVPKTMDNDVYGTDYCIGFSTAVSRSVEAINALRTTTESHERIAVVELFGRRSGETALLAGFLAQVDRTVIAEVTADLDVLLPLLVADRKSRPTNYAVCVISEGARLSSDDGKSGGDISKSATQRDDIGVGQRLAREIEARTGQGTVVQELAYLMRAGEPDAMDRMVGFAFGGLAIQLLQQGKSGRMVALRDGNYCHVPAETLLQSQKSVDVSALYDAQNYRAKLMRVEGMPMFLY